MLEIIIEAVMRKLALDMISGTAGTCTLGAAALEHEAINNSVEGQTVIKALIDKADKVIYSIGSLSG